MNFELTEERQMLQDSLRRYLAGAEGDIWAGLAELGVIGALFSEEQGGFGGAGFDLAVVFEELGRADLTIPLIDNALLPGLLMAAGGLDVEGLIGGAQRLALAHGETAARYDLNWVETRAEGDRLTGEKTVVVGAEDADSLIVSARHFGAACDEQGIGLWLVAKDAPGLQIRGYDIAQGGRAAEVSLTDVEAKPLIAEAGSELAKAFAAATLAEMAQCLGAMDICVAMTQEYLTTRKQFGRPIGTFQALTHRLVDVVVAVEQARSMVILAAGHLEAEAKTRDLHIAAAKNLFGRSGRLASEECIQMHGGIGMTEEYALGRYAKRITMSDHRFGDTDHHLERFIQLGAA
ncbi:acyl-CoA dehydrogenase family protein [Tropicibacter sp. R15_0]|uniref:acyl-CoA dehydrogenase family protein n=1 Tax=Tropicibacter sp. R15_0 TaxID=2821101 RepID=UPI001ADAD9DF|nr:acyl-CoA dehydrogenase [Tropicibacter sp. R15_0]MBO9465177.1 acyl-CoA dehydrogenase family protein [Tropicibacter sp. R15_0]